MKRFVGVLVALIVLMAGNHGFIEPHAADAAATPDLRVIVVAGIGSNTAEAKKLRDEVYTSVQPMVAGQESVKWVSYKQGAAPLETPYEPVDTCMGVDVIGENLNRIMDGDKKSRFVIVGHSLGGFAIANWANSDQAKLDRVVRLITLDSPLALGPTSPILAFDSKWTCSQWKSKNDETVDFFKRCGFLLINDHRCRTFEQLTSTSIGKLASVPAKIPLVTFDCTTNMVDWLASTPPCLQSAASQANGGFTAGCAVFLKDLILRNMCLLQAVNISLQSDLPGAMLHRTFENAPLGHNFWQQGDVKVALRQVVSDAMAPVPFTMKFVAREEPGRYAGAPASYIPFRFGFTGYALTGPASGLKIEISPALSSGTRPAAGNQNGELVIWLPPTSPAVTYTLAVTLPDGRRAVAIFDHKAAPGLEPLTLSYVGKVAKATATPNSISYKFAYAGYKFTGDTSVIKTQLSPSVTGWARIVSDGELIICLPPTTAVGTYTLTVEVPGGRSAKITFQHTK